MTLALFAIINSSWAIIDRKPYSVQADEVRHMKITYIKEAREYIVKYMRENLEDGKTFCTNRTNPLAPMLQPYCVDKGGRKMSPVCYYSNYKPDPVDGCIVADPSLDEAERLTKMTCPKMASREEGPICQRGFKPIFIPNEHKQRKVGQALVVCRDEVGAASRLLANLCQLVCSDGDKPDPCLGCLDRSELRCKDNMEPLCPYGSIATVMTSPYQCELPYRCDPVKGTGKSVMPSTCQHGNSPRCYDEHHEGFGPDDCLACRDHKSIPICPGLCPQGYVPHPIPHFFCNNPYQNKTNLRINPEIDRVEKIPDDLAHIYGNSLSPRDHARLKRDLVSIQNEIFEEKLEKSKKKKAKKAEKPKYGGKHGPLRATKSDSRFDCMDSMGETVPMRRPCLYNLDPVCADGQYDDPCLGCAPSSHYHCPEDKMEDFCPDGYTIEKKPAKYCKQFKFKCPQVGTDDLGPPVRCHPDAEPVCMSLHQPGVEWPVTICGCGPYGEPYCSGPGDPGAFFSEIEISIRDF
jgi:hypothetical protein